MALLLVAVGYVILLVGLLAVAGFVAGYTFRKGWDRAGRTSVEMRETRRPATD